MRWERLFEDVELQAAADEEWARADLAGEAERVRIARSTMRERLIPWRDPGRIAPPALLRLAGEALRGRVVLVGEDVVAIAHEEGAVSIIRIGAIDALRLPAGDPVAPPIQSALSDRLSFAYALRDCARRRRAVRVRLTNGAQLNGTLDRVGADYCDLAEHDPGQARRAASVAEIWTLALGNISCVRVEQLDVDL
ncbi:hypothetical protein GCM10009808_03000 [Microbacterium sediminicola]|uniref:Uncharacterized protein n=1 Tax=Microbacterium sediminicola TaxID=415210 RepID=A0ABN2HKH4_9MICO